MSDKRQLIINQLQQLVRKRRSEGQSFKAIANQNAINSIKKINEQITSIDQLKNIKGIGKGILSKIEEIFKYGYILELQEENKDLETISELMDVHGIGQKKAKELTDLGVTSIEDLKNKQDLLNDVQLLGLKFHEDISKKIPRKEIDKYNLFIEELFKKIDKNIKYEITGSYRRGLKESGDIDIIVTHETKNCDEIFIQIVEELKKSGVLKEILASGNKKMLGISKLKRHKTHRRLDILCTEKEVYPFALLHFTGSKSYNVRIRQIASSKGLSLSEFGLKNIKDNKSVEGLKSEKEILNYLGLEYVEPHERKD